MARVAIRANLNLSFSIVPIHKHPRTRIGLNDLCQTFRHDNSIDEFNRGDTPRPPLYPG